MLDYGFHILFLLLKYLQHKCFTESVRVANMLMTVQIEGLIPQR